jgi:hypothetical protein
MVGVSKLRRLGQGPTSRSLVTFPLPLESLASVAGGLMGSMPS